MRQPFQLRWTEKDYNWKVKLPGVGHSSPVVLGRRVFVTSGDPDAGRKIVCCLDAADGRIVWQRDYPSKTGSEHPEVPMPRRLRPSTVTA